MRMVTQLAIPRSSRPARTRMVSTTAAGAVGNASSGPPRISGNGRYAAFHTYANNIVAYTGGCCSIERVVRKDLDSGAVTVVSLNPDATLGSGWHPDISRDGSRIVFSSSDGNLNRPGGKTAWDHFLWDAATPASLTKVSTGSAGEEQIYNPPAVIYSGQVHQPAISADGRFVAFSTDSGTLTSLGGNGKHQVYVKDTVSGSLTLASVASNGALGDDSSNLLLRPQMSSNGHVVAFFSYANNLIASTAFIKPLLHDWTKGVTTLIADVAYPSTSYSIGLSPDPKGRYAVMDFGQTTLDPAFPSKLGVYLADFYPLLPAVTDITPILTLLLD